MRKLRLSKTQVKNFLLDHSSKWSRQESSVMNTPPSKIQNRLVHTSQKANPQFYLTIPILTGNPGGKSNLIKSLSLAKWALVRAMRSMIGMTCSTRERGNSSHIHSVALNLQGLTVSAGGEGRSLLLSTRQSTLQKPPHPSPLFLNQDLWWTGTRGTLKPDSEGKGFTALHLSTEIS